MIRLALVTAGLAVALACDGGTITSNESGGSVDAHLAEGVFGITAATAEASITLPAEASTLLHMDVHLRNDSGATATVTWNLSDVTDTDAPTVDDIVLDGTDDIAADSSFSVQLDGVFDDCDIGVECSHSYVLLMAIADGAASSSDAVWDGTISGGLTLSGPAGSGIGSAPRSIRISGGN
ncbi:MAG: hypothetical protein H6733_13755 [Alphaproteobacteria bacterium]|nr:hypothetical protein [Alphaproteobacteria bacterium]